MIVVVPVTLPPVTTPVSDPTLATDGVLLVHVPPEMGSLNVMLDPVHTLFGPDIAVGNAVTDTVVVAGDPHPLE